MIINADKLQRNSRLLVFAVRDFPSEEERDIHKQCFKALSGDGI